LTSENFAKFDTQFQDVSVCKVELHPNEIIVPKRPALGWSGNSTNFQTIIRAMVLQLQMIII